MLNFNKLKRAKTCKKQAQQTILSKLFLANIQHVSHKAAKEVAEAVLPRSELMVLGSGSSGSPCRSGTSARGTEKC